MISAIVGIHWKGKKSWLGGAIVIINAPAERNSERAYVVSADQHLSMELDLNKEPRVSVSKIFEFTIAATVRCYGTQGKCLTSDTFHICHIN